MHTRTVFLTFAVAILALGDAISAEGPVVWTDTSCNYLIVQLPEGNPDEAFGLYRSNTNPMPKLGDVLEGDIVAAYELDATDKATGQKYSLFHWANGKSAESLVRHSPVQCLSRFKKN